MYGKTLSLPDEAMDEWFSLLAFEEPDPPAPPRDRKRALARAIVARFYDEAAAAGAEEAFDKVFVKGGTPDEVPEHAEPGAPDPVHLPALLASAFGISTSEARRLVAGGGVKVDGEAVSELDVPKASLDGAVLQAGKRRFVRLKLG
jgi:tyrosyl-tRNA synthetase